MQLQFHIRADLSEQISLTFVSIMEDIQIKKKAQMTRSERRSLRPHDVDRDPGHREVLERLLLPLLLRLPRRALRRGAPLRRRLRHGGAELPQAETAAARDVAVGRQHAGALPAQQLLQQQHDGRHERAARLDRSHQRSSTRCWILLETSSGVGIWKVAVAAAAAGNRVALGDGWEGEAELGDLSMPRPCRCELTVGGAWFSTVRRAMNGSRQPAADRPRLLDWMDGRRVWGETACRAPGIGEAAGPRRQPDR